MLDLAGGHFVATMTVLNGQGTLYSPEPTVIDVDLTWPPEAFPPGGPGDAAAETSAAGPTDGSPESGTSDAFAPADASDDRAD